MSSEFINLPLNVVSADYFYYEEYPPLYGFLVELNSDIIKNTLKTDAYYIRQFYLVFNLSEPWSAANYINQLNNILATLPGSYTNNICSLQCYLDLTNIDSQYSTFLSYFNILKYLIDNISKPTLLDIYSIFDQINTAGNQAEADYLLFTLIINITPVTHPTIDNILPVIYNMDAKYNPANSSYYYDVVSNINNNGIIYSNIFLEIYITNLVEELINVLATLLTNMVSFYTNILSGNSAINLVYQTYLNGILTFLNTTFRTYVNNLKSLALELNISSDLNGLIDSLVSNLDATITVDNLYQLAIILNGYLDPINLTTVNNSLGLINSTLASNQNPQEVQYVIDQIGSATYNPTIVNLLKGNESTYNTIPFISSYMDANNLSYTTANQQVSTWDRYVNQDTLTYYADVSNSLNSVIHSLTPGMLTCSSGNQVTAVITTITSILNRILGDITAFNNALIEVITTIENVISFINGIIRGLIADLTNVLGFLNALTGLVGILNSLMNSINTLICTISQLLCIANKFISSLTSIISQVENIGSSLATSALNSYNSISAAIQNVNTSAMMTNMASAANSTITGKIDSITSQVSSILGASVADTFKQAFSQVSTVAHAAALIDSGTLSNIGSFVTNLETSLLSEFLGELRGQNCTSGVKLPSIKLPALTVTKINFSMPGIKKVSTPVACH